MGRREKDERSAGVNTRQGELEHDACCACVIGVLSLLVSSELLLVGCFVFFSYL